MIQTPLSKYETCSKSNGFVPKTSGTVADKGRLHILSLPSSLILVHIFYFHQVTPAKSSSSITLSA